MYIMIKSGTNINKTNDEGYNILSYIMYTKYDYITPELYKFLIDNGADASQQGAYAPQNEINRTHLMTACREDSDIPLIKYLLSLENVDVNAKDKNGNTALMLAEIHYYNLNELILLLKDKGADFNIKNEVGISTLFRLIHQW